MSAGLCQVERLSDIALLQKLVGVRAARRLYRGSLAALVHADRRACPSHDRLIAARELIARALAEQLRERCVMSSPGAVKEFLRVRLSALEYEVFVVLFLDAQHALIASEEMFRGTLSQTSVYPREVVRAALRHNAGAVILAHNHPSGVAEPSRADELLTQSLKSALALVDVRVLDHIVVAGGSTTSLAERGLL